MSENWGGGQYIHSFLMECLLGTMHSGGIQETAQFLPLLSSQSCGKQELGHTGVSALARNIQVFLDQIRRGSERVYGKVTCNLRPKDDGG